MSCTIANPMPCPCTCSSPRTPRCITRSICSSAIPGPSSSTAIHRLRPFVRSEEHTSELQSLMRISYAVFCLKKKKNTQNITYTTFDTNDNFIIIYTQTNNHKHKRSNYRSTSNTTHVSHLPT